MRLPCQVGVDMALLPPCPGYHWCLSCCFFLGAAGVLGAASFHVGVTLAMSVMHAAGLSGSFCPAQPLVSWVLLLSWVPLVSQLLFPYGCR